MPLLRPAGPEYRSYGARLGFGFAACMVVCTPLDTFRLAAFLFGPVAGVSLAMILAARQASRRTTLDTFGVFLTGLLHAFWLVAVVDLVDRVLAKFGTTAAALSTGTAAGVSFLITGLGFGAAIAMVTRSWRAAAAMLGGTLAISMLIAFVAPRVNYVEPVLQLGLAAFQAFITATLLVSTAVPAGEDSNYFCPRCGYDLAGNARGVCPECGWEKSPISQISG